MASDAKGPLPETESYLEPAGALPGFSLPLPELSWEDTEGKKQCALTSRGTVGSAPDVAVRVAHPTVSRLHCELDPRPDGLWIRDLASRNGTFVDGVQVHAARVPAGGKIRLGSVTLTAAAPVSNTAVELWPEEQFHGLWGRSIVMRALFARLSRLAQLDTTVLLQGETGTGKEAIARALHQASSRGAHPFVTLDCASIPESLAESELFGHTAGAFTGAREDRPGAFEQAAGGTLFLDEVGELPLALQPKLLRVLETKTVRRLGDAESRAVDVRFISATHRDLEALVASGGFREDLFYRLAVVPLEAPPLRKRLEDLPLLVAHFLGAEGVRRVPPQLLTELRQRAWTGNLRELRNVLERAAALGDTGEDRRTALPLKEARVEAVEAFERSYFRALMEKHQGSVPAVAAEANVDRTYVYRLLRKYGMPTDSAEP